MKNKKTLITGLFCGLILLLITVYGVTDSNKDALVYIVKRGDTLWNIALRFNANPWLWPKLWEQNKYIANPHLIYPGEPIALLPTSVVPVTTVAAAQPLTTIAEQIPSKMPQVQAEQLTPPAVEEQAYEMEKPMEEEVAPSVVPYGMQYVSAPANTYIYPSMGSAGFVSKQEIQSAGEIVGAASSGRTIFGEHDVVFINLGANSGVKEGDEFNIYKTDTKIYDPETDDFLGYRIKILGRLKITKVEEDVSTATITHSYEEIKVKDKLIPYEPGTTTIDITLASNPIKGYIICGKHALTLYGENDIVYIDRGSNDGVQVGNTFVIYKDREPVEDPVTHKTLHLPKEILGKLLVIKVQSNTATAIITKSAKEISIGDKILADTASGVI
ncbi:MAG: FlgT C-terminal domain-containing protein [bacterium]